ncbi:hypothetical protein BC937DRAFT_87331 [Endogone sp. FLAS-F59071]|nr:hypothetical protein BC937DRAFT_87331 [Endogone sp. FLAS-F59071]|eukprot:RUS19532.1 hypothetical protein BC937DRAFT_87331 [Endogone sp. FLAS-F59071]
MMRFSKHDIIALTTSLFVPPLAVLIKTGFGSQFWISIILTLLGYIPGIIYAWFVIYQHREPTHDEYVAAAARDRAREWEHEVQMAEARTTHSNPDLTQDRKAPPPSYSKVKSQ